MRLESKLNMDKILGNMNIANDLSKEQLSTIGSSVLEGYRVDELSRAEWLEKYDKWMELVLQTQNKKTFPWPGAANVKHPLILLAAMQFGARSYPTLITGTKLVRGTVNGFDDDGRKRDAAIRISKHMSYQFLEEMPYWEEDMDKLCNTLPIVGCMFKKTYFSPVTNRNESELISAKDLVINYWTKNLVEAPRVTHIIRHSQNNLYERVAAGLFLDLDLKPDDENIIDALKDDKGNAFKPADDDTIPYTSLEQHTFLDLDGDGYKEPYIVTVDRPTGLVQRIVACFDENDIVYSDTGKLVRIKAKKYFTKWGFIPNPDGGFYDIGFGLLLGPLNEAINTILNMLLDAGALNNLSAGFIQKGIRVQNGDKPFKLGEFKTVQTTGQKLQDGIMLLPTKEPSNVLFSLLGLLIDAGQKVGSVTDMMAGESPGQNQPATTSMALLEQGMKVFTAVHKRMYRSMKQEFKLAKELNRLYLDEDTYFQVLDMGEERMGRVSQMDYELDVSDVTPTADPNMGSQMQKLVKAQDLMQLAEGGKVNPQVATKAYLEAMEHSNIEELLQMPEPQPNPEFEMDNMKFEDESQRDWRRIDIEAFEARVKAEKVEADIESGEKSAETSVAKLEVELAKERMRGEGRNNSGTSK